MGKGREKESGNERFNILVVSKTDARTRPVNFSIRRKGIIALLMATAIFIVSILGGIVFLIVRNADDERTISALGGKTKEQVTLIDQATRELQLLYKSLFKTAENTDDEETPSYSPAADVTADHSIRETQEELGFKTKFDGKIGDTFILPLNAPTNTQKTVQFSSQANVQTSAQLKPDMPKVKYKSSNPRVAKVTTSGEVTLTGPGKAVITCTTDKNKKTLCQIKCESQFDSVHYRQGDLRWKFPLDIKKRACITSSFAIALENAGIHATPRTVFNTSGLNLKFERLSKKFGITFVNALSDTSPYLKNFDGGITTIKDPAKNYVAAMKEALDRHPDGVCVYFKGRGAHMIVAIGYVGDDIYYSDPGRAASKGYLVKFPNTWVYYKHKMTYKHVAYFVAFDQQKQIDTGKTIVTADKVQE